MVRKPLFRILFVVWISLIAVLSLIPTPSGVVQVSDKLIHAVVYIITTVICLLSLNRYVPRAVFFAGISIFLYSFVIELVQYFLPYRSFSVGDLAANITGIVTGVALLGVYHGVVGRHYR